MIFIGLDVSKISTALCIEKNNEIKLFNYTTNLDNYIWIKKTNDLINYRHVIYNYTNEKDYSKSELLKLDEFDITTNLIINDIFDNINLFDNIKIGIEGYSYNSKTGPIFDLIEFTTILKIKLMRKLTNYTNINIISPLTLKNECCKMVYEPRIELVGKRVIKEISHIENNSGKQASKFDKWDMFDALIHSNIDMKFREWCIEYNNEITINGKERPKKLPKPIDDIIDSIFLKETVKKI